MKSLQQGWRCDTAFPDQESRAEIFHRCSSPRAFFLPGFLSGTTRKFFQQKSLVNYLINKFVKMITFKDVFSNSPQITTAISEPTKSRYEQVGTDVYVCVRTHTVEKTVCLYLLLSTLWAHILLTWPETLISLVLLYLGVYLFQMNGRKKKREKP